MRKNMDKDIQIAGYLTVGDWLDLSEKLNNDMNNPALWDAALQYFDKRIQNRYLNPIKAIENNSNVEGEGFSVVAILCSLIEALESFNQGKTYRKATKGNPLDPNTEYFKSQSIFESFLNNREPFKSVFSNDDASSFYENVRCSILHEAATRNGWRISIRTNQLVQKENNQVILNRVFFVQFIEQYIEQYKKELKSSLKLKQAYIRKFNSICESA